MTTDTRKEFLEKARLPHNERVGSNWLGRDFYVALEGVIGVGKTSLTRMLQYRWGCEGIFEGCEQNPFLTRGFYQDQKTHGFNTEIFFLLTRFRQQEPLAQFEGSLVSDYLFQKNWVFAQMNLSGTDLDIFKITYDNFIKHVRQPDLVVLLEADLETILRRIYFRDREFERSLSAAYIEKLSAEYYRYFSGFDASHVLRINTCGMDFVQDPQDFLKVANAIEERLKGVRQLRLEQGRERNPTPHASTLATSV